MKIHIDSMVQKLEDLEKKSAFEMRQVEAKLQDIARDKTRIEELLTMREKEVRAVMRERDAF